MSNGAEAELVGLERARCAGIGARDLGLLGSLLADDYLHVHTGGNTEDRERWLEALTGAAERSSVREDLEVRLLSADVALMSGTIVTTGRSTPGEPRVRVRGFATQTWVRHEDRWLLAHFHVTALGAVEQLAD